MAEAQITELQVEGMTCSNCANTVRRKLERDGLENVSVNFATGEVSFSNPTTLSLEKISADIDDLGYHVVQQAGEKKNS